MALPPPSAALVPVLHYLAAAFSEGPLPIHSGANIGAATMEGFIECPDPTMRSYRLTPRGLAAGLRWLASAWTESAWTDNKVSDDTLRQGLAGIRYALSQGDVLSGPMQRLLMEALDRQRPLVAQSSTPIGAFFVNRESFDFGMFALWASEPYSVPAWFAMPRIVVFNEDGKASVLNEVPWGTTMDAEVLKLAKEWAKALGGELTGNMRTKGVGTVFVPSAPRKLEQVLDTMLNPTTGWAGRVFIVPGLTYGGWERFVFSGAALSVVSSNDRYLMQSTTFGTGDFTTDVNRAVDAFNSTTWGMLAHGALSRHFPTHMGYDLLWFDGTTLNIATWGDFLRLCLEHVQTRLKVTRGYHKLDPLTYGLAVALNLAPNANAPHPEHLAAWVANLVRGVAFESRLCLIPKVANRQDFDVLLQEHKVSGPVSPGRDMASRWEDAPKPAPVPPAVTYAPPMKLDNGLWTPLLPNDVKLDDSVRIRAHVHWDAKKVRAAADTPENAVESYPLHGKTGVVTTIASLKSGAMMYEVTLDNGERVVLVAKGGKWDHFGAGIPGVKGYLDLPDRALPPPAKGVLVLVLDRLDGRVDRAPAHLLQPEARSASVTTTNNPPTGAPLLWSVDDAPEESQYDPDMLAMAMEGGDPFDKDWALDSYTNPTALWLEIEDLVRRAEERGPLPLDKYDDLVALIALGRGWSKAVHKVTKVFPTWGGRAEVETEHFGNVLRTMRDTAPTLFREVMDDPRLHELTEQHETRVLEEVGFATRMEELQGDYRLKDVPPTTKLGYYQTYRGGLADKRPLKGSEIPENENTPRYQRGKPTMTFTPTSIRVVVFATTGLEDDNHLRHGDLSHVDGNLRVTTDEGKVLDVADFDRTWVGREDYVLFGEKLAPPASSPAIPDFRYDKDNETPKLWVWASPECHAEPETPNSVALGLPTASRGSPQEPSLVARAIPAPDVAYLLGYLVLARYVNTLTDAGYTRPDLERNERHIVRNLALTCYPQMLKPGGFTLDESLLPALEAAFIRGSNATGENVADLLPQFVIDAATHMFPGRPMGPLNKLLLAECKHPITGRGDKTPPSSGGGGSSTPTPEGGKPTVNFNMAEPKGAQASNVVWLTPQDFIALTSTPLNIVSLARSKWEPVFDAMKRGDTIAMPHLSVDAMGVPPNYGGLAVVGHDGRHRAFAAIKLNVDVIPVRFYINEPQAAAPLRRFAEGEPLNFMSQDYDASERKTYPGLLKPGIFNVAPRANPLVQAARWDSSNDVDTMGDVHLVLSRVLTALPNSKVVVADNADSFNAEVYYKGETETKPYPSMKVAVSKLPNGRWWSLVSVFGPSTATERDDRSDTLQEAVENAKGGIAEKWPRVLQRHGERAGYTSATPAGGATPEAPKVTAKHNAEKYYRDYLQTFPSLQRGKVEATLEKAHGYRSTAKGKIWSGPRWSIMFDMILDGYAVRTEQVKAIKDPTRRQFNNMDGREQDAFEKKQREAGMKTEYQFGGDDSYFVITKIEHDYAMWVEDKLNSERLSKLPKYETALPVGRFVAFSSSTYRFRDNHLGVPKADYETLKEAKEAWGPHKGHDLKWKKSNTYSDEHGNSWTVWVEEDEDRSIVQNHGPRAVAGTPAVAPEPSVVEDTYDATRKRWVFNAPPENDKPWTYKPGMSVNVIFPSIGGGEVIELPGNVMSVAHDPRAVHVGGGIDYKHPSEAGGVRVKVLLTDKNPTFDQEQEVIWKASHVKGGVLATGWTWNRVVLDKQDKAWQPDNPNWKRIIAAVLKTASMATAGKAGIQDTYTLVDVFKATHGEPEKLWERVPLASLRYTDAAFKVGQKWHLMVYKAANHKDLYGTNQVVMWGTEPEPFDGPPPVSFVHVGDKPTVGGGDKGAQVRSGPPTLSVLKPLPPGGVASTPTGNAMPPPEAASSLELLLDGLTQQEIAALMAAMVSNAGNGGDFGIVGDVVDTLVGWGFTEQAVGALVTSLQKKKRIHVYDPVFTNRTSFNAGERVVQFAFLDEYEDLARTFAYGEPWKWLKVWSPSAPRAAEVPGTVTLPPNAALSLNRRKDWVQSHLAVVASRHGLKPSSLIGEAAVYRDQADYDAHHTDNRGMDGRKRPVSDLYPVDDYAQPGRVWQLSAHDAGTDMLVGRIAVVWPSTQDVVAGRAKVPPSTPPKVEPDPRTNIVEGSDKLPYFLDLVSKVVAKDASDHGAIWLRDTVESKILKKWLAEHGVNASIKVRRYSMASGLDFYSGRRKTGDGDDGGWTAAEIATLKKMLPWQVTASYDREKREDVPRVHTSIYPHAREDKSDMQTDYFSPGGPVIGLAYVPSLERHIAIEAEEAGRKLTEAGKLAKRKAAAPPRERTPSAVGAMSVAALRTEQEKLVADRERLNRELIEVGRGRETFEETIRGDDALSVSFKLVSARLREVAGELEHREKYGQPSKVPDAPASTPVGDGWVLRNVRPPRDDTGWWNIGATDPAGKNMMYGYSPSEARWARKEVPPPVILTAARESHPEAPF